MAGTPSRATTTGVERLLYTLKVEGQKIGIAAEDIHELSQHLDQYRRATEALTRQTPELQMLLQILDLANGMVCDSEDRIIRWTDGCRRLYGYSAEEALGHRCHALLHTHYPQPVQEIQARLLQTHRWEGELVQRRQDGQEITVASRWVLHPEGDGYTVLKVNSDITPRRQAEEQFHASEARYRSLMDSVPALVWSSDPQTEVFDCNRQWSEYTGLTPEQAGGMGWVETIHPDDRLPTLESRSRALATGRPAEVEHRLLRAADGAYRWFVTRAVPVKDPHGRTLAWVGASVDIDDLKQAQEALRETGQRLTATLARMSDGFVTFDRQWRYTYVNPAAAALLGATPAELLGRTIWEAFPVTMRLGVDEHFRRSMEQGTSVQFEVPCGDRWYESRCHPGPEGLAVFFEDITDRKLAEAALQQSEAQFRQLADGIPQLAWTARPDGMLDYFNERVRMYQGFVRRPDGLWDWHPAVHPEDLLRTQEKWAHARQVGEADEVEHRLRMADGQWRWHLTRAVPVRDEQGHVHRWFGTGTDIEEYKRASAALTAATRTAEEARIAAENASRAKDQFLAILSHELRTPLTPVLATAQMMEMDELMRPEQRESVEMIRRNVELEARLIDDLLDLTRIARGKLELHLQVVDVHDKIRHVLEMVQDDAAARQLTLVAQPQAQRYIVQADGARLQQMLWNLLANAVKFTPPGGQITVRTENLADTCPVPGAGAGVGAGQDAGADQGASAGAGGCIAISVRDTGIGIAPEVLPRLFNAFEQGGRGVTRQFGGLGLGLAISKSLAEMHGGTLTADSEGPGKGATFTLELPILPAVSQEPSQRDTTRPRPAAPQLSGRLLLVEDHPDTAKMMARLLRHLGFQVRIADSVAAALAAAEAEPFDLLISDLGLPDGTGLDVIRQLSSGALGPMRGQGQGRGQERGPLKAIALSGFGMEEDIARSKEAGFAEHLTKPVDLAQLRAAIERILAKPQ